LSIDARERSINRILTVANGSRAAVESSTIPMGGLAEKTECDHFGI
jgi:hypothetical protein